MDSSTTTNTNLPSLRPWLIGVVAALAALSALFVALRLLCRRNMQQKLWWDDWLIIMSLACNCFSVGLIFAMYSQGLGLPSTAVPQSQIATMTKIALAAKIVFTWNLCLTKVSILFMYYRVFDLSRSARVYAVGIGAFVVLWSAMSTCLFILTCNPIQKMWNPNVSGRCISLVGRWIASSVSTVLTDLAIIFLPMPQVFRMSLSKMGKLAVTLVFAQGFLYVLDSDLFSLIHATDSFI